MLDPTPPALVRSIAGFGLPRETEADPIHVGDEPWPAVLEGLVTQHLTGIAIAGGNAGWLRLSDRQMQETLERHKEAMCWDLLLERRLLSVVDAFERAGVEVVVLKGSALAHSFYPEPGWRSFEDLDLLVPTRDWRRACGLLEQLGFHRDLPEPRPGFDERFGKAASHTDEAGFQVDLHRTLVLGAFGLWMNPDDLFDRTAEFALGGRRLRRLDDTATLLHACMHASLGAWPVLLLPLRDVAQVACRGRVDWPAFGSLAERWKLRSVVRHALRTVRSELGVELPAEAATPMMIEPSARELRVLRSYASSRRGRGGMTLSVIRCIPGFRERAFYVRALLLPDRQFLAARGEQSATPPSYVRRWLRPVRRLIRRRS
ncbi:MAG: nucleotidyltransferase family protein [Actinomycetota bacterium]